MLEKVSPLFEFKKKSGFKLKIKVDRKVFKEALKYQTGCKMIELVLFLNNNTCFLSVFILKFLLPNKTQEFEKSKVNKKKKRLQNL